MVVAVRVGWGHLEECRQLLGEVDHKELSVPYDLQPDVMHWKMTLIAALAALGSLLDSSLSWVYYYIR